ncbi:MAG: trypsin-like peptidase domain-containing protein [Clostridiales bacterium]|nr:trypsin-like peptidase domain-containing protein [Clostridiales bacterium]
MRDFLNDNNGYEKERILGNDDLQDGSEMNPEAQERPRYQRGTPPTNKNPRVDSNPNSPLRYFENETDKHNDVLAQTQRPNMPPQPVQRADMPRHTDIPQRPVNRPDQPMRPNMPPQPAQRADMPSRADIPQRPVNRPAQPLRPNIPPQSTQRADMPSHTDIPQRPVDRPAQPLRPNMPPQTAQRADMPGRTDIPQRPVDRPAQPLRPNMPPQPAQRGDMPNRADIPQRPVDRPAQPLRPNMPPQPAQRTDMPRRTDIPQRPVDRPAQPLRPNMPPQPAQRADMQRRTDIPQRPVDRPAQPLRPNMPPQPAQRTDMPRRTDIPQRPVDRPAQPMRAATPLSVNNEVYEGRNNSTETVNKPTDFSKTPLNENPKGISDSKPQNTYVTNLPQNPTAPRTKQAKIKTKPNNSSKTVLIVTLLIVVVCLALVGIYFGIKAISGSATAPNNNTTTDTDLLQTDTETSSTDNIFANPDTEVTNPNSSGLDIYQQPNIDTSEYSAQHAYEVLSPSVVGVVCYKKGLTTVTEGPASEGTGIIVTSDGYIATNSHVIGDSKTEYDVFVTLGDEQYEAKPVGFDTKTDLAVLKIKADKPLVAATFADSTQISVGQDVVAIGNPGGNEYSNSITRGIISAINRSVSTFSYVNYIQTDAAINPGNSGGPLANLYGQVIGINTIKIVDEEYEGMGFAIPSATVKSICDDLITQGYVSNRVRIGITGKEVSETLAATYGCPPGILIIDFSKDSPFKNTKAKANDLITAFNGVEISSFSELYTELDKYKPGDEVTVTLYREASAKSKENTFDVKIKLLADLGETQETVILTTDTEKQP